MGFFFRKSFRIGPIRLNLSKSGLDISAGVKGAHIGVGTPSQETLVLLILGAAIVLVAGLIMFAVMKFFG